MLRLSWIVLLVLVADQLTKWAAVKYLIHHAEIAVTPFMNLTLVFNAGAAFGFLSSASGWQNLLFVIVAIVVSIVILFMFRRLGANDVQVAVALMLVFGGAVGNLIDRLRFGYVIDFVDIYYNSWHWPAFNVADSAITIGAVLLVLDAFGLGFHKRHDRA